MQRQPGEWSSGEKAAKAAEAAARRSQAQRQWAHRKLLLIGALSGITGAIVVILATSEPGVRASIETRVPPSSRIPLKLFGAVAPLSINAELHTLALSWLPDEEPVRVPTKSESIFIEIPVSARDCERLAEIGGSCGGAAAASVLHNLEWLRVEARGGTLSADVTVGTAPRFELGQTDEPTSSGAPSEWSLTEHAAMSKIQLSCGGRVRFSIEAVPNRRGPAVPARTAACRSSGTRFRLQVLDDAAIATTIGFGRLHEFEAAATADRGRMKIDHGTVVVDGDSAEVGDENPVPVELRPESGDRVSLRVRSPVADAPAMTRLESERADQVLIGGAERTPIELERIPNWLIATLLVPWIVFLVQQAWRPLRITLELRRDRHCERREP